MPDKRFLIAAILLVLAIVAIAGCTGTSPGVTPTAVISANNTTPPGGVPPSGTPPGDMPTNGTAPGGMPPGDMPANGTPPGSGSAPSYTLSGVYTVDGIAVARAGQSYTSDTTDMSAVYVTNGGTLDLADPTITTTGNTSSGEASSFYGLNGAVLANNGSRVTITGGTITTSGSGANGAIPTGTGTSIVLSNVTIKAAGDGGHGVMATLGGSLDLTDVDMTTSGPHGAPIATDRGSGTVNVTRGTVVSSGIDSPGIYSTGAITVTDAAISAKGSEAAVIEGANSIALTNTTLAGSKGSRDRGIMLYQSMSGDAESGLADFAMTGGAYTWPSTTGPAFYVTNTKAAITLKGVSVMSSSAELLNASAGNWGTSGSNGGTVTFTADGETLSGSLACDGISSITAILRNGTTLTGAINAAALTLDATSTWIVTADSTLTGLVDTDGISGTGITNIIGNGHNVYYDASLHANSALGGKTFTLVNGGKLTPK